MYGAPTAGLGLCSVCYVDQEVMERQKCSDKILDCLEAVQFR